MPAEGSNKHQQLQHSQFPAFAVIGIMSSKPETFAVTDELIHVIRRLQESGQLAAILGHSSGSHSTLEAPGAMHDGSKRRFDDEDIEYEDDFSMVSSSPGAKKQTQMPCPPTSVNDKSAKIKLPEGVKSMDEWGRTMCDLPKVAVYKMSYDQLVKKSSTVPEIAEYLGWIVKKSARGKSAKMDDLYSYRSAVEYGTTETTLMYPGSTIPRVIRPSD